MDKTEKIPGAALQHGKFSDRVYLMKLEPDAQVPAVLNHIDALVAEHQYSKIFAKVRASQEAGFLAAGYRREGIVGGMYEGTQDGVFLARYPHSARQTDARAAEIADVLAVAESKRGGVSPDASPPFAIRRAVSDDAQALAALYRTVFKTYPFPILEPDYILETMGSHVVYFVATDASGALVAASSIEMDQGAANAEMTDFATLPACRGKSIATHMLRLMEREAPALGIKTAFTIARALSHGMNVTFARLNYQFGGTLVNNTQISGHIESMNIWYKKLGHGK